jgi:HlyD family secretion protein
MARAYQWELFRMPLVVSAGTYAFAFLVVLAASILSALLVTRRVRLIEPSGFTKVSALGVEEQRVNVIADFDDAPDSLGDGYRIEARIIVWQGDDVLQVPASALFRRGSDWNVFVVEHGRARRRQLEVGRGNAAQFEVKSGLEAGEVVILHPSDLIHDGVSVAP